MICTYPLCSSQCLAGAHLCPTHAHHAARLNLSELTEQAQAKHMELQEAPPTRRRSDQPARMSEKYPRYYKPVPEGMKDVDIYALCQMFNVQDNTGAVHHAVKKLLLPGVRTGKKTRFDDIKEARDTLTRWLELNTPTNFGEQTQQTESSTKTQVDLIRHGVAGGYTEVTGATLPEAVANFNKQYL